VISCCSHETRGLRCDRDGARDPIAGNSRASGSGNSPAAQTAARDVTGLRGTYLMRSQGTRSSARCGFCWPARRPPARGVARWLTIGALRNLNRAFRSPGRRTRGEWRPLLALAGGTDTHIGSVRSCRMLAGIAIIVGCVRQASPTAGATFCDEPRGFVAGPPRKGCAGIIPAPASVVQSSMRGGVGERSPVGMPAPLDFGHARAMIAPPGHHEEQIAKPVEIAHQSWVHRFHFEQAHETPLGATAHGAREMELRAQPGAAGQDERGERLEVGFEPVDPALQRFDVGLGDLLEACMHGGRDCGELGAHVEELGLDRSQRFAQPTFGIQCAGRAERGVQLVHAAVGLDARRGFRHATRAQKARRSVVAGAGVDLHGRQSRAGHRLAQARPPCPGQSFAP